MKKVHLSLCSYFITTYNLYFPPFKCSLQPATVFLPSLPKLLVCCSLECHAQLLCFVLSLALSWGSFSLSSVSSFQRWVSILSLS